jgi:hypothetical protein
MEDYTIDIMKASIDAVQEILRANPNLTLEQFVQQYEQWFLRWAATLQ